ncbi:MAG: adaptor protein MecA [Eubacteriales bacterium]|nr:adaptor protein MecA [Eubacteriales bacterium]
MKIEKINDHQIRCTLTREDLRSRELKLSELAYGSEKAKSLFREMMQKAALEVGFEANDIPLMIEAIPLSAESLVLIITKVEDPEELDTRFAKFAPSEHSTEDSPLLSSLKMDGADDILSLFQKIRDAQKGAAADAETEISAESDKTDSDAPAPDVARIYAFDTLDEVIHAARILSGAYHGDNTLYKLTEDSSFRLLLHASDHTPEEFNRICNMLSEYGSVCKYSAGIAAGLSEHAQLMIVSDAVQRLASL